MQLSRCEASVIAASVSGHPDVASDCCNTEKRMFLVKVNLLPVQLSVGHMDTRTHTLLANLKVYIIHYH